MTPWPGLNLGAHGHIGRTAAAYKPIFIINRLKNHLHNPIKSNLPFIKIITIIIKQNFSKNERLVNTRKPIIVTLVQWLRD